MTSVSSLRSVILGSILAARIALAATVTVMPDVTIIDGTGKAAVPHQTLVLDGGTVSEILPTSTVPKRLAVARIIHYEDRTVLPALINAHGHLGITDGMTSKPENYTERNVKRQLLQYEAYGVTTVMALGLNKDLVYGLRERQRQGIFPGATILTAGRGIGVPAGVPGMNVGPDQLYRPKTVGEARRAVREMAAYHPNLIKIWVDDNFGQSPKPNMQVEAAVIDEAHREGLRVAAHIFYLADAKALLRDGVDILAHSVRDKEVDSEFIQLMKRRRAYYIPTLDLEEAFFIYADQPQWLRSPFFVRGLQPSVKEMLLSPAYVARLKADPATEKHRQFLKTAEHNVKAVLDAGIPVGFGTDSGAMPTRIQGFAEHRELQLLVDAGFTPLQALHSATGVNAKMLEINSKTGTIEAGKSADLIVLDADPISDINNTGKILAIFHNGLQVKPIVRIKQ
jgi:imidazolonepropionase-like amidohydrolase